MDTPKKEHSTRLSNFEEKAVVLEASSHADVLKEIMNYHPGVLITAEVSDVNGTTYFSSRRMLAKWQPKLSKLTIYF